MARKPQDMGRAKVLYARAFRGQASMLLEANPNVAERLLRKAVEADPHNSSAHFDLGKLYTKAQDYPRAIRAYQIVVDLNPLFPDALYNLGFVYATTNDYENAEKMFYRVTELKPLYLDKALFNLAMVQQKQGKRQECIESLGKSLIANPYNERAQEFLSLLNCNSGDSGSSTLHVRQ